ncbi:MAG: ImuA family protein [Thermaurantiacus sp.]
MNSAPIRVADGRATALAELRRRLAAVDAGTGSAEPLLPIGCEFVDSLLGGGLLPHALHEILPAPGHPHAHALGAAFAARIAGRIACREGRDILWAGPMHDLFPPGLAHAGLPPAQLLFARANRDRSVLAAMEEAMGSVAGVVGELQRPGPWLTAASRRLQLRAARTGTLALLLHRRPLSARVPTAAASCWELAPAPSAMPAWRPLHAGVGGPGIGPPCLLLTLARARGAAAMVLPQTFLLEASWPLDPDAPNHLALASQLADRPASARPVEGRCAAA